MYDYIDTQPAEYPVWTMALIYIVGSLAGIVVLKTLGIRGWRWRRRD